MENNINQELVDRINRIKIPADFKEQTNIIPLGKSVIIKQVKGAQRVSKGGLLLAEAIKTNELLGRIVAVGPDCLPYLKVGLLVSYNSLANMEAYINGETMIMLHESSVYYIFVDNEEEVTVTQADLSPEAKRKVEKAKKQQEIYDRLHEAQQNAEDVQIEIKKKSIKKQPKKK